MRTTRQDINSLFKAPTSLLSGDLVLSEDTADDQARQPSTGSVRATAPGSLEGELTSAESSLGDEDWVDFEDMPDLEKLVGWANLSDLENLPDLEELLDLEESDSEGTFLPATKSGCRIRPTLPFGPPF